MAPLTWRNVNAPNMDRAANILNQATQQFSGAFDTAGNALGNLGAIRRRNQSAAALPTLARVAEEDGVDAALNQVTGQVAPRNRSEALLSAMANLRGNALDYEQSRAGTDLTKAQTGGVQARTSATRAASSRAAQTHARSMSAQDQLNSLAGDLVERRENAITAGRGGGRTGGGSAGEPQGGVLGAIGGAIRRAIGSGDPRGSGQRQEDFMISDLIPENNQIPVSALLDLTDNNYAQFDTARRDSDDNRVRDFEFGNSVTDRNRADARFNDAETAQSFVMDNLEGTTGMRDGLAAIFNSDMSPTQQQMAAQEYRNILGNNPEILPQSGGGGAGDDISRSIAATLASVDAARGFAGFSDPTLRSGTPGSEGGDSPAAQGDGGGALSPAQGANTGETALQAVNRWRELEGVDFGGTTQDMMTTLQSVSRDHGLSPDQLIREAENSFSGYFAGGGRIKLNKGFLEQAAERLSDPQRAESAAIERHQSQEIRNELSHIQQTDENLVGQIDTLMQIWGYDESHPQIQDLMSQREGLAQAAGQLNERLPLPAGWPGSSEERGGQADEAQTLMDSLRGMFESSAERSDGRLERNIASLGELAEEGSHTSLTAFPSRGQGITDLASEVDQYLQGITGRRQSPEAPRQPVPSRAPSTPGSSRAPASLPTPSLPNASQAPQAISSQVGDDQNSEVERLRQEEEEIHEFARDQSNRRRLSNLSNEVMHGLEDARGEDVGLLFDAARWLKSPEARVFFATNPEKMIEAQRSPGKVYQEYLRQSR